nr:type II toxin-antitoxin system HicA family toxin [Sphaerotilus sp.]
MSRVKGSHHQFKHPTKHGLVTGLCCITQPRLSFP